MNLNRCDFIGRLTADPEVRQTPSGQTVVSFSIATNEYWMDKQNQRQERTEFINVVAWGKLGETAGKYLKKGQEAYVSGRMQTRSWDGKDGQKKYRTEIVATTVQFGNKAGATGSTGSGKPMNAAAPAAPAKAAQSAPTNGEEITIEDIPF